MKEVNGFSVISCVYMGRIMNKENRYFVKMKYQINFCLERVRQEMERQQYEEPMVEMRMPLHGVRICVDRMGDSVEGRVYSLFRKEAIQFYSWTDMILKMDHFFDEICFPQAFEQKRSFREDEQISGFHGIPKQFLSREKMNEYKGKIVTLELIVISRKYANWQGILLKKTKNEKMIRIGKFESEMEILKLLREL